MSPLLNVCFDADIEDNTYDSSYEPSSYGEVLTLKFNLQIIQRTEADPRNFEEDNPVHQAFINDMLTFFYDYLDNVRLPFYEGGEGVEGRSFLQPGPEAKASAAPSLQLAPTPAKDLLTITYSFEAAEQQGLELRLTDIFGKELMRRVLPGGSGTEEVVVSGLKGAFILPASITRKN